MRSSRDRVPFYLTFSAVVASLISPAAAAILIAAALLSLLIMRQPLKMPPLGIPIALLIVATLVSAAFSDAPLSAWPQIRKFYLFLVLILVSSTFRRFSDARLLLLALVVVSVLSSGWSLVQFANKYRQAQLAGSQFYEYYTGSRITGFMSHWMTLGGQQMNIILLAASFTLFVSDRIRKWLIPAILFLGVAMLAGWTRSIWLGTAVGGLYLVWCWRRWFILLTPLPVALLLIANPANLRERVISSFQPHGDTDSNRFREICRVTGWEIIKAHPLLGLGPEQVKVQFQKWIPADVKRPLPPGYYQHLHNVYYQYAAERGIPALLALLAMFARILWDFWSAHRCLNPADPHYQDRRYLLHGGIAVTIAVLVTAFYEVNIGDGEVLILYLATVGIAYLGVRDTTTSALE